MYLRSYAEARKDFRDAFLSLAEQCEGFVGHSQTFRSLFEVLVSRYGLDNLDTGLKMLVHMDFSITKQIDLAPKISEFIDTLKRIRGLHDELEALQAQSIRPDLQVVTA